MKSTEEFIKDMFAARKEAAGGKSLGFNPFQRLVFFFSLLIALGTILLMLPWATPVGQSIRLIDALFTATSAICVTGLIVQDTATAFSPLGQVVILVLIKIGGLGYMIFATAAAVLIGKRLGIHDRVAIKQAMNLETHEGMNKFLNRVLVISFSFELIGALVMTLFFMKDFSPLQAAMHGIFHSISGFNNAGFSLFSDNLAGQSHQPMIIATITFLALFGGLGFFVLNEFLDILRKKRNKLSVHSKIVLTTTAVLLIAGTLGIWFTAHNTLGEAFFLSSISRTAGFNIQDTGAIPYAGLFFIMPLMFIGASPGGTGGGIKTTTFAMVILSVWATLRGKNDVVIFHRRITSPTIFKALMVGVTLITVLISVSLVLFAIEGQGLIKVLFEVTSALGTVGLSVGDGGHLSLSALFSVPGKLVIIFAMLIGRLGPLTLGLAAAFQAQHPQLKYPEGRVSIG